MNYNFWGFWYDLVIKNFFWKTLEFLSQNDRRQDASICNTVMLVLFLGAISAKLLFVPEYRKSLMHFFCKCIGCWKCFYTFSRPSWPVGLHHFSRNRGCLTLGKLSCPSLPAAMPCWWVLTRTKQLSMAATPRVIWQFACVRYWSYREVLLLIFNSFPFTYPLPVWFAIYDKTMVKKMPIKWAQRINTYFLK